MAVDKREMNIKYEIRLYIKRKRQCLTFRNIERRVQNTTRSGVFLRNTEVFGNAIKHCLECLINLQCNRHEFYCFNLMNYK